VLIKQALWNGNRIGPGKRPRVQESRSAWIVANPDRTPYLKGIVRFAGDSSRTENSGLQSQADFSLLILHRSQKLHANSAAQLIN
jgi:hypothetical protein